ncbi:MAG: alpha/beta-type small acid-soluble spore protein [Candidatus Syntrophonatronum acetioxidans]|uniref:Alpha/beta-type small acid-soluble spore protein n=1 Tax=Candidatus Syntrophonatronum acetioxidans TaxID=1795816 RepID=A0A424YHV1_9FIRM|nr:MAG: alpha/beta-type small acid-soluble spore protein [Candidatus Syntrophonatronum acetioxidans]
MATQNRSGGRNRILVPGAEQAMEKFKYEVANELGINYNGDLGNLTSRQNGYVGGIMVKKMIADYQSKASGQPYSEQQIIENQQQV